MFSHRQNFYHSHSLDTYICTYIYIYICIIFPLTIYLTVFSYSIYILRFVYTLSRTSHGPHLPHDHSQQPHYILYNHDKYIARRMILYTISK